MDFSRIRSAVDVSRLQSSHVAAIGVGGAAGLTKNLVRCGVGKLTLVDPDRIEPVNMPRQDHRHDQIGEFKAEALGKVLRAINPDVTITPLVRDVTSLTQSEVEAHFGGVDLLIFATDCFAAQAKGNEIALQLGKPAVWVGLYPGGLGGEVVFWHSGVKACYRCLMSKRYEAQASARQAGMKLDPPSDGATVLDVDFVDAIAGQIGIGLLTMGAQNRFGRLIERLGQRSFVQVKIDPDYLTNGQDLIRKHLRIQSDCKAFFGWNSIALEDPTADTEVCEDCLKHRSERTAASKRQATPVAETRPWPSK